MKNIESVILSALCMLSVSSAYAQIKISYGPYLQNVKADEATIVWESDKNSVGWVELAPDDGTHFYGVERTKYFDTTNGVKNSSQLHAVKLEGLQPATTYRYRIYSMEVLSHEGTKVRYGDVAATDVYNKKPLKFTTSDYSRQHASFVMLNDIHGRSDIIPKLLQLADYQNKDFVVYNGDMVSIFSDKQSVFDGFMNESISLFASEKPMYYARGNHETRGNFATSFQKYFSPKEPHLYYVFRQGPACFIVLDTGEDKPDSDIEYSGITDYDNYRTQQQKWLESLADNELVTGARFRIVIAHMPPSISKDIWHGQKEVLEKFVPALNKLGTDLMLCGHLHVNQYEEPGDTIRFPVIVNSNESVLSAEVSQDRIDVTITDINGKTVMKKTFTK